MLELLLSNATETEMNEAALINAAWSNPNGGFVRITGYVSSESGEVADHLINGNVSYTNCLERSLAQVKAMTPEQVLASCPSCDSIEMAAQALLEVTNSYEKSLLGENKGSNYEYLAPGVAHLPTENGFDAVYVWGLAVGKTVHQAGEYKQVKSKPLTLVKAFIQKGTPCAKFRRFKLTDSSSFTELKMAGHIITPALLRRPLSANG